MNKNNITHPENMNTEDTKKEMTPSAFPPYPVSHILTPKHF